MNFTGLIIAIATFIIIGIFHPIVIKAEYYLGVKVWWMFLVLGMAFIGASLFISNQIVSMIAGVVGCSCLWSILELFEQRKRVERGWFPKNPNRRD
ncbi:MAG: DUF4491 family protein [Bacteroidales bacterium]|nr:DUF4491 family protein [Bacteroidales bacterium]